MKIISTFSVIILFFLGSRPAWSLEKESAHFVFYYEAPDSSVIDTIGSRLEGNYNRITGDLHLILDAKVKIHIYPTLQEFHGAVGWPDAPDWFVGMGTTEIYAVSPLNPGPAHSYNEMVNNVFVHEFTHICEAKINGNLPIWLNEGFACYEGGPYYSKESVVASYNSLGRIPSLDELNSSFDNFVNLGGYPFCLTITRFAIETFGMDSMRQFIHRPDDYSVFGGLSKSEFQEKWFTYVKVNYLRITSVQDRLQNGSSRTCKLEQNYPNPFNPTTNISYEVPANGYVTLKIYNLIGGELQSLVSEEENAGRYEVKFDGSHLSTGIYFYKLTTNLNDGQQFSSTRKLVLMK